MMSRLRRAVLLPRRDIARKHGSLTANGDNPPWESLPEDRRADLAQRMAVFAGMVTGMDRNIGRIIADLRAHGELDNTLIIFLSDNGACAEWEPFGFDMAPYPEPQPGAGLNAKSQGSPNILHRGADLEHLGGPGTRISYGSGWANAGNTPWRMYKHYDHEGGISAPFIVHWPARVKAAGKLRTQVGHVIDLMATCVEVSGATHPAELDGEKITPPEGRSLLSGLDGSPLAREYLAWEHEGKPGEGASCAAVIGRSSPAGKSWSYYSRGRTAPNLMTSPRKNRGVSGN